MEVMFIQPWWLPPQQRHPYGAIDEHFSSFHLGLIGWGRLGAAEYPIRSDGDWNPPSRPGLWTNSPEVSHMPVQASGDARIPAVLPARAKKVVYKYIQV